MNEQENIYQSSETVAANGAQQSVKNSKIGLVSFVLALLCILSFIALFGYMGYLGATGQLAVELGDQQYFLLGFSVLICLLLLLVSLVLGTVGLFQKDVRKTFAIMGVSLSTISIILIVGAVWFGATVE